jgi:L-alanine-DL-glutamate epimerase-like enolase superfamily enzyme
LLEGRKIAALAEMYYIPVAPHGVASPLGTMAYAHVSAVIPNLLMLEWTHYLNKSMTSLTESVTLNDGCIVPTAQPGIGVALNEDVVKERTEAGFKPL